MGARAHGLAGDLAAQLVHAHRRLEQPDARQAVPQPAGDGGGDVVEHPVLGDEGPFEQIDAPPRDGQGLQPGAQVVDRPAVRARGVHPYRPAEQGAEHLAHAEGMHRHVGHGGPGGAVRHAGRAVRAVLHHEGARFVGARGEGRRGGGVDDPVGMLDHDRAHVAGQRERVGVERGAARRELPVPRLHARGDDGIDGRAAGEQLRHDGALPQRAADGLEGQKHTVARLEHEIPVGRVGAGAVGHDPRDALLLRQAFHVRSFPGAPHAALLRSPGMKRPSMELMNETSGSRSAMPPPKVMATAGMPPASA